MTFLVRRRCENETACRRARSKATHTNYDQPELDFALFRKPQLKIGHSRLTICVASVIHTSAHITSASITAALP
jgi:hypothetical protein